MRFLQRWNYVDDISDVEKRITQQLIISVAHNMKRLIVLVAAVLHSKEVHMYA